MSRTRNYETKPNSNNELVQILTDRTIQFEIFNPNRTRLQTNTTKTSTYVTYIYIRITEELGTCGSRTRHGYNFDNRDRDNEPEFRSSRDFVPFNSFSRPTSSVTWRFLRFIFLIIISSSTDFVNRVSVC